MMSGPEERVLRALAETSFRILARSSTENAEEYREALNRALESGRFIVGHEGAAKWVGHLFEEIDGE